MSTWTGKEKHEYDCHYLQLDPDEKNCFSWRFSTTSDILTVERHQGKGRDAYGGVEILAMDDELLLEVSEAKALMEALQDFFNSDAV